MRDYPPKMTSISLQTSLQSVATSPSATLHFPPTSQRPLQTTFFFFSRRASLPGALNWEKATHPDATRLRGGYMTTDMDGWRHERQLGLWSQRLVPYETRWGFQTEKRERERDPSSPSVSVNRPRTTGSWGLLFRVHR